MTPPAPARPAAASPRTEAMRKGRQADSARRRQRVIATLNRAAADGTEITVAGIARAASVDRAFLYRHRDLLEKIHALEAAPPAAGTAGPAVTCASLQADLLAAHERCSPAQRPRPAAGETPVRSTRRAGLARVRTRRPRRHRRPQPEGHPPRTAGHRPAPPARRTRPGPHRGPGRQPGAHGPAQRHATPPMTRRIRCLRHTCRAR